MCKEGCRNGCNLFIERVLLSKKKKKDVRGFLMSVLKAQYDSGTRDPESRQPCMSVQDLALVSERKSIEPGKILDQMQLAKKIS